MSGDGESVEYWLISVPNNKNQQQAMQYLRSVLEPRNAEVSLLENIPTKDLRVGTLDTLIALSDELGKIDQSGKNITAKLHRTYRDLENSNQEHVQQLDIQHKSIPAFIKSFKWDEGHFNTRANLKDLVQTIHGNMQKNAEHLRKRTAKLSEIESNLQAIVRKKSGSLMNKSLKEYVTPEDWVKGEYIGTALVVVPKQKKMEFESSYDRFEESEHENEKYAKLLQSREEAKQAEMKLNEANDNGNDGNDEKGNDKNNTSNNDLMDDHDHHDHHSQSHGKSALDFIKNKKCPTVVPDSAKILHEDNEFALYRVVLLNQGYPWFKFICREKGYNVRDFEFGDQDDNDDEKMVSEYRKQRENLENKLKLFCKTTFSETFVNWMHLKIIRCFVEAVLRYGLPVDFSISCVKPPRGVEKKLLKHMDTKYQHLVDQKFQQQGDGTEMDYSGLGGEFHPYVYIPLKIDL